MKKISFAILLIATFLLNSSVQAQTEPVDPHLISCFDYYKFGSVQVPVTASVGTAAAGTSITFNGSIDNTNTYPVVDGRVVARIFKINEGGLKSINGPDVVDNFVVKDNISIAASSSIPLNFDWKIPQFAESGTYKVALFFVSGEKFNLLGLTFTDDIIGNSASFSVVNEENTAGSVRFVKSEVYTLGQDYFFAAFPPHYEKEMDVPVTAQIKNTTKENEDVTVTWKVYSWDAQQEANLLETETEVVNVPAGGVASTTHIVKNTDASVYYAVAEFTYKDAKSIIAPRFVRDGVDSLRINFPAVDSYPLKKGQETQLFSCLHATNEEVVADGTAKLVLTLKDLSGNVIHSYTYSGSVTADMMGVKDDFIPEKDYKDFTLTAELYKSDILMDKADMHYTCNALATSSECRNPYKFGIVMLLGLLLAVLTMIITRQRVPRMEKTNTTFAVILAVSIVSTVVSAAIPSEVVWNPKTDVVWNATLPTLYVRDKADGINKTALNNPNVTVTYKTEIKTESGQVLQGGETLPVDTKLAVKFIPHIPDHVYWFGTGSSWDSPYGSWGDRTVAPPKDCAEKDYVFQSRMSALNGRSVYFKHYISLVVNPPTKTLTDIQGMNCTEVASNGTATCTVTGGGPVSLKASFANTSGSFYYRRTSEYNGNLSPCYAPNPDVPMALADDRSVPYTLQVPAQQVAYSFVSGPAGNRPPTAPVISGPRNGSVDVEYQYGFVSTDPDNDTLKYGIDWIMDDGKDEVTVWVPGSDFVADEIQQFANKTWSNNATYTFKVMAQDSKGASSPWSEYQVIISPQGQCMVPVSGQAALFQAHGRDYFLSTTDGQLYFAPQGAGASAACSVDMCANTATQEAAIPANFAWNTASADAFTKYSCVPQNACGCTGRTYTCSQPGGAVTTVNNAPQCSLQAACTYALRPGRKVEFRFTATNVIGTLQNGGTVIKDIPVKEEDRVFSETRELIDSFDNQKSTAVCNFDGTDVDVPDPKILTFTATPIVEKGTDCKFDWTTQDMASCTLGGEDYGPNGNHDFNTDAGNNIVKTLSCMSDEDPARQFSQTKTCLVRPTVIEQ